MIHEWIAASTCDNHITHDSYAKHLLAEQHHGYQPSDLERDYTWAACGSISDKLVRTRGFKFDDAILSPLLGYEKLSTVHILIDHSCYILSSGTTHS